MGLVDQLDVVEDAGVVRLIIAILGTLRQGEKVDCVTPRSERTAEVKDHQAVTVEERVGRCGRDEQDPHVHSP
jgi:hypothetical protein